MRTTSQSARTVPAASTGTDALPPLRRLSFSALGTMCEVHYASAAGDAQAEVFERAVIGWVAAFEAKYSRFRPDSLVSRINTAAGRDWVSIDPETEMMLKLCDSLHFLTGGILDPTTLPLLWLWDYTAEKPRLPRADEVATARALVGWKRVQRQPGRILLPQAGMGLDFGAFGKEYAVDFVARLAADHGITSALIDFGHDVRGIGTPPGRPGWVIGLEDPRNPGVAAGRIGICGEGVASSGDYIRGFEISGKRYGHIVDPRTGWPVANGCRQVTVIAPTCLQAGVLSTTAFVLGVSKGIEFIQATPGAEGFIVTDDARAETRGFGGKYG
ncbi:MAG: FAD:protein FMN transferase [Opitutaceae bacterium]|nr:FAD:protein FMN transferase [Opitutaceae bacterium]